MAARKRTGNFLHIHNLVPLIGIVLILLMLAVIVIATNTNFNFSYNSHAAEERSCDEAHGVYPKCQQACQDYKVAELQWGPIKNHPNAYAPNDYDYWSKRYRETKTAYNTCMSEPQLPPTGNPTPAPTIPQRDLSSYACQDTSDCRIHFTNTNLFCNTANPRRCVYFDCRRTDATHANPQTSCPRDASCDSLTGQCVGPKLLDCANVGIPAGVCRYDCYSNEQLNDYAGYCGSNMHCCMGGAINEVKDPTPTRAPRPTTAQDCSPTYERYGCGPSGDGYQSCRRHWDSGLQLCVNDSCGICAF